MCELTFPADMSLTPAQLARATARCEMLLTDYNARIAVRRHPSFKSSPATDVPLDVASPSVPVSVAGDTFLECAA